MQSQSVSLAIRTIGCRLLYFFRKDLWVYYNYQKISALCKNRERKEPHNIEPDVVTIFFKFFNWRIIASQNFVVFCHTSTRISHRYTHVPSLPSASPSHPSACHRAPACIPWVTQQIPNGCLFYIWYCKFPCYSLHTSHLPPPPLLPCA